MQIGVFETQIRDYSTKKINTWRENTSLIVSTVAKKPQHIMIVLHQRIVIFYSKAKSFDFHNKSHIFPKPSGSLLHRQSSSPDEQRGSESGITLVNVCASIKEN